jgi:hypothetical protein
MNDELGRAWKKEVAASKMSGYPIIQPWELSDYDAKS